MGYLMKLPAVWIALHCLIFVNGLALNNTEIPTIVTISSKDTSKTMLNSDVNDHAVMPPLIFPNDASSSNETAIKILLSREKEEHIDSELNRNDAIDTNKLEINLTTPKPAHIEPTESDAVEVDENLKNEVEEIQNPEEELGLEELFHKQQSSNLQVNPVFAEDIETNGNNLHGGHITAIFIGVLAIVSISIYVTLIIWRSYLEKRYGMREQLVTEDDYYNNNDIRHFAL